MNYKEARKKAITMADNENMCVRIIKSTADKEFFDIIDAYELLPFGFEGYELIHKLYSPLPNKTSLLPRKTA